MSNPWFRMYAEFAHDPKVQMLSEVMQRRYLMILCLRCSNTLETLHETELAFHLRISEADLAETHALFVAKKFIDKNWNPTNWDKRQFVSDSSTERVSRYREKKKEEVKRYSNGDETKGNVVDTDTDTDTDKKKKALVSSTPSESLFEKFWTAFPVRPGKVKVGKKPCATKWQARHLDKIADQIIANVEWQKKHNREWVEGFAPNPEVYINQDRWADGGELGTTGVATAHPVGASPTVQKTAEQIMEQRIIGLRDLYERYGNEAAKAELETLGVRA